ncbi:MAG: DUF1292 domain-containing protein [Clostridiales bacterium]|nr:DUF1292 domain-containing protein [Clostridiales bacterium]
MYENTDGKFVIETEDGQNIECQLLFSYDSPKFKKTYIVYTDGAEDENGDLKFYASVVEEDINGEDTAFSAVNSPEEWEEIDEKLNEYLDSEEE